MAAFLKGVADTLPARPKAIVLVSGHWLESAFSLTGHARPPLIYDYSGFPPHTYELTCPAPGNRALAELRDKRVLIVGSGMSFHNMRGYGDPRFTPISAERDALLRNWTQPPHARLCHPPRAEEHLIPLMVAAGAGAESAGRKVYSERLMETTISAFRFG